MVSVLGWRSLILSILFSLSWSLVARSDTEIDQLLFECVVNTGSTPVPLSSEEATGETLEKLRVSGFKLVGNTVFSQDTLSEAIADFTEREISFVELIEAVSRITQKYNDQRYINSSAIPYPQKVTDGVVKIAVIEGGLGSIFLTRQGKGRLYPDYICDRVAIAVKPFALGYLGRLYEAQNYELEKAKIYPEKGMAIAQYLNLYAPEIVYQWLDSL